MFKVDAVRDLLGVERLIVHEEPRIVETARTKETVGIVKNCNYDLHIKLESYILVTEFSLLYSFCQYQVITRARAQAAAGI